MFYIFIGMAGVKAVTGAQMNTNCAMLPVSDPLVHTPNRWVPAIFTKKTSRKPAKTRRKRQSAGVA